MLAFFEGKKTYISAGLIGVAAVLQALGYPIPEYIYAVLGAVGLGSVRAAIVR